MNQTSAHYSLSRLRASLVHFGIGQALNGVLGLIILLQIARALSLSDYGQYVVFVALVQMGLSFSMLGLNTVGNVYVPQYRLHAAPRALMGLVMKLISLRAATLLAATLLVYLLGPLWGRFLHLQDWDTVFRPYVGLMIAMGLIDYWQRGVFQPLLKQGYAQAVGLARNVLFSVLLAFSTWFSDGPLTVSTVLQGELLATSTGALLGIGFFVWSWFRERGHRPAVNEWTGPPVAAMVRMSGYNYASHLLYSLGDAQMVLLVAGRMLDHASTAALGFCLSLYGQLLRYLPAHLLWNAIQPKLVASYSQRREFGALNEQAMLIYKASVFLVAPLLAVFLVSSENILALLSGGKYGAAHGLALALLVTIIPASHSMVLGGLVNTVEQPQAGAIGNLAALSTVPVGVLLVSVGLGAYGLIAALTTNVLLYNALVIRMLNAAGLRYRIDYAGLLKIGAAAAGTAACLAPFMHRDSTVTLVWASLAAAGVLFLLWAYWVRPFTAYERALVNRGVGRPLFIW